MKHTQSINAATAAPRNDENTATTPTVRPSWNLPPLPPGVVLANVDNIAYQDKETCAANYRAIRVRLAAKKKNWKLAEAEFAKMCSNGQASGYFHRNGSSKGEDWKACQALFLDFDDGFSRRDFNQRCREVGIHPTFAYATLSDGIKGERFRAVFILDEPTTDPRIWRAAMCSLKLLFKEADSQCFDAARIFLGGKRLLQHEPGRRINVVELVDAALYFEKQRDPKNFSKRCRAFTDETTLATSNGHLLVVASPTSTMIPADAVELIELPGEQICDTKGCGTSK